MESGAPPRPISLSPHACTCASRAHSLAKASPGLSDRNLFFHGGCDRSRPGVLTQEKYRVNQCGILPAHRQESVMGTGIFGSPRQSKSPKLSATFCPHPPKRGPGYRIIKLALHAGLEAGLGL